MSFIIKGKTIIGEYIVKDGLVLYLDAGNYRSYPTLGTVWHDISGNGYKNHVILKNGPSFIANNGGNLLFDGLNDYADFYAPNLTTTSTVEMWAKVNSFSNVVFFSWLRYDVWTSTNRLGYNTTNGDLYGISESTITSLDIIGKWAHYVFEMKSNVAYTNNKIYINGVSQSLSQILGSEDSSNRNFDSGNGRLSGLKVGGYFSNQNVSIFKVYNRALTPQEVLQNYNVMKLRYL